MLAIEDFFWFCALCGSLLFALQCIMSFLGGLDLEESDASGSFKWLSKQALAGFLMTGGWTGLAALSELQYPKWIAITLACAAGICSIFLIRILFRLARKLHSKGSQFSLLHAVGKEGMSYQEIPKGGIGKVTLTLDGFSHEIDAVTEGETIPSFTPIEVIQQVDERTVIVVPKKR